MKKIKSITRYSAFVGKEGIPKNEYKSTYQEFDINQHLTKDMTFTHDREVETASGYKFNESNVLIEEVHYLNETEVAERLVYQYDKNGELCEVEKTYADGTQSIKKVNRNGQRLTVTVLDESDQLEGEEIRIYDEQGNVLEEAIYDENDFLTERISYTMGQQYALEPGVLGRTGSNYISTVFHYEFYE